MKLVQNEQRLTKKKEQKKKETWSKIRVSKS